MIKYTTSTGERVSEATIKKRLSDAYKNWYSGGVPNCAGCGNRAIETSHIIAKARCKVLKLTDLIWMRSNTFPSCRSCHLIWENYKSGEVKGLINYEDCMNFLKKYDMDGFLKRTNL